MATKQRRSAGREETTVNLPGDTAEFHQPDHYMPMRDELAFVINTVRGYLPSPRMLAFYGGLGALAVLEVIEWPVAAAIGVGTAMARRSGGAQSESSSSRTTSS